MASELKPADRELVATLATRMGFLVGRHIGGWHLQRGITGVGTLRRLQLQQRLSANALGTFHIGDCTGQFSGPSNFILEILISACIQNGFSVVVDVVGGDLRRSTQECLLQRKLVVRATMKLVTNRLLQMLKPLVVVSADGEVWNARRPDRPDVLASHVDSFRRELEKDDFLGIVCKQFADECSNSPENASPEQIGCLYLCEGTTIRTPKIVPVLRAVQWLVAMDHERSEWTDWLMPKSVRNRLGILSESGWTAAAKRFRNQGKLHNHPTSGPKRIRLHNSVLTAYGLTPREVTSEARPD